MAVFNATNPVVVGGATKKDDFDRLWDNVTVVREGGVAVASQAANDLLYASSGTQLARLVVPSTPAVLANKGALAPAWMKQCPGLTRFVTNLEASTRFTQETGVGGVNSLVAAGAVFSTGAGAGVYSSLTWDILGNLNDDAMLGSPTFFCHLTLTVKGSDGHVYAGLGKLGLSGSLTFTTKHVGFKIIWTASGAASLFGTVGDGATETATAALTTVVASDEFDLVCVMNAAAGVDFYFRKNGGAISGPTTVSANIPTTLGAGNSRAQVIIGNIGTASNSQLLLSTMGFER